MLFNSIEYLFFLTLVATVYYLIPQRIRYIWLLVSSYFFYMSWNPSYALLLLTVTTITYFSGLLISYSPENRNSKMNMKKMWVILSFILTLSFLFFFKYSNFAIYNINIILNHLDSSLNYSRIDILLPLGISFYTFQALSYTVDVYRGDVCAEKNFLKYALFVSFFPMLVSGPIERSKNFIKQISEEHYFEFSRIKNGVLMFLWGLFMKIVISDKAAIIVNTVFGGYEYYAGIEILIAILLYTIQIYCDFAGYSYMAIGSGQILGFKLMENFNTPYFASSVADFWRRWHISLSSWFKDYLYIPLGGNRKGKYRKYFNIMFVFLVSGFWHGASWTFIIWGGLHGLFQIAGAEFKPARDKIVEKFGIDREVFSHKLMKTFLTFSLVSFAWIFFRATSLSQAIIIIKRLFSTFNIWVLFDGTIYDLGLDKSDIIILISSILLLFFVSICKYNNINLLEKLAQQGLWFRWCVYLGLIFAIFLFGTYGPGYKAGQFIYFQF